MKKFLSVVFLSLLFMSVSMQHCLAQGNLQFNQVKYFQMTVSQVGSSACSESSQVITVPAGKVWKIEMATSSAYFSASNSTSFNNGGSINLDGKIIFNAASASNSTQLPFWIPAGSYTLSLKSNFISNGYVFIGSVSAIEFNIVP